jgi:hypothetical protein
VRDDDRGWFRREGLARLDRHCLAPPQPPIRDVDSYYAYLESLPKRFWTRDTLHEIEYAGKVQRRG